MNAAGVLKQQLDTVNLRLHHSARDLTPDELVQQPIVGVNPLGFILWHIPRSQDWAINTAVRNVPELTKRNPWNATSVAMPGIGTGFSPEEAMAVAQNVRLPELIAYADAVHRETVEWLTGFDEDLLDEIPDAAGHDAPHPEYQTVGFRAEMDGGPEHDDAVGRKGGLPVWVFLTSVSITHLHRHLGEVDLIKDVIRSRVRP